MCAQNAMQKTGKGRGLVPLRKRNAVLFLLAIALATLAVCVIVAGHHWRIGIPDEWQWDYYPKPASWVLAAPAVILSLLLAAAVAICLKLGLKGAKQEVGAVALCLLLSLGIILVLADAGPHGGMVETLAVSWVD